MQPGGNGLSMQAPGSSEALWIRISLAILGSGACFRHRKVHQHLHIYHAEIDMIMGQLKKTAVPDVA